MKYYLIGCLIGFAIVCSYVSAINSAYDRGMKDGDHDGWMRGYEERGEDEKRWNCMEYSNTFRSEVPAKCIKYFTETK